MIAKSLRYQSWGKIIEGVSVAHPAELLIQVEATHDWTCQERHPNPKGGYIGVIYHDESIRDKDSTDPYKPYSGSKTKPKVRSEAEAIAKDTNNMIKQIFQANFSRRLYTPICIS